MAASHTNTLERALPSGIFSRSLKMKAGSEGHRIWLDIAPFLSKREQEISKASSSNKESATTHFQELPLEGRGSKKAARRLVSKTFETVRQGALDSRLHMQGAQGQQYVSKLDAFESFVSHAKLAPLSLRPVDSLDGSAPSAKQRKLVLVEDLPYASASDQRKRLLQSLGEARIAKLAQSILAEKSTCRWPELKRKSLKEHTQSVI